jgi:hypothetical protein
MIATLNGDHGGRASRADAVVPFGAKVRAPSGTACPAGGAAVLRSRA